MSYGSAVTAARADRRAGQFGTDQHLRAEVFYGLEGPDRPPELLARPGVLHGEFHGTGGGAELFGGREQGGHRVPRRTVPRGRRGAGESADAGTSGVLRRARSPPPGPVTRAYGVGLVQPLHQRAVHARDHGLSGCGTRDRSGGLVCGHQGPGSSVRPASSKSNTASGSPSPTPPSASGSRSAKQPPPPGCVTTPGRAPGRQRRPAVPHGRSGRPAALVAPTARPVGHR